MPWFGRAFSVARCFSSRPLQTATAASPSSTPAGFPARSSSPPPLLARLLREPESGVKETLELDKETEEASSPGRKSDALFWEPLLVALRSSSPRKAHLVLEWKLEKLLEEDVREHKHFSNLITLCAKLENLPFAMRVFTTMESRGIRSSVSVFNALIHACISSDNVPHALSLFEIMSRGEDCKPNLATYNAFIAMRSKWGESKGMLGWYSAAKSAGFSPDVVTYQALITGFTRAGEFEDAGHYFEEMVASGIMPNVDILGCVLEGLCRQKKLGDVEEFWTFLLAGGWDVNERMVENILSLYTELSMVEEMEELLKTLQRNLNSTDLLFRVHCGIIKLYACLDRLDAVEYSVGRMLRNGMQFTCSGDVEAVISCYFRQEAYERLDLFLERVRRSYRLMKSTYDLLIAGYRRVGLQDRLEVVKKDMKNEGFA
ncbi:hypothetical protein Taro_037297 [Colocasia esculenta]|uniref:PROP1-like PPR domain-containing protein n=1 Tax=Colocasia esculenta TaxID=4460 RepID=A0A843WIU1_COLES|nr:hypothetical protein [Colocasia esculenta]